MSERIIQHAQVKWIDDDGQVHRAFRRQTVDTSEIPGAQLERLEEAGAFASEDTEPEDLPTVGELPEFSPDMSDEELVVWLRASNVQTVVNAAAEHPDQAERLLDAEAEVAHQDDREVRKGIEKGIEAVVANQG